MAKTSPRSSAMGATLQRTPGDGESTGFTAPPIPRLNFPRETGMRYTPWLLIRDAAGDTGARPLPGGTVFWESPDVWVEGLLGINRPVVGQRNQVFARVTNLGWQYATGVNVKFWWANPSLAITESSANLIGTGWADIPSGWSVVVQCPTPWIPVFENGGHECLIAEAYIPVFDPLTAPMDPVDDRHVGQKNEYLITLRPAEPFRIDIHAANVFDFAQSLTFEVQPVRLPTLHPLVAARAQQLTVPLQPSTSVLPLSFQLSNAPAMYTGPSTLFASRLLSRAQQQVAGTTVETTAAVQISHTAHFEPWETRIVEITGQVPSNAQAGQTYVFRVIQRVGRLITGGYTVNVVVGEG
jgi:hypothetical protein